MSYQTLRIRTEKRRSDRFRYGQNFDDDKIDVAMHRKGYANFYTEGMANEALSVGFDITDMADKVVRWNDRIQEFLNARNNGTVSMWQQVLLGAKFERGFGKALLQLFKDGDGDNTTLMMRSFKPKDYDPKYNKNGSLKSLESREYTVDGQQFTHRITEASDLSYCYELIMRPGEYVGEGVSFIEPVWDQIYSMNMLDANATYFAIRIGGGLRVIKIPEAKLKDTVYMAKVNAMLESLDSENGTVTLPIISGPNNTITQPDFELKSGDQIDFTAIRDLILGSMSVGTRVPRETQLGSELGLRSSQVNESAYHSVLQGIQEQYRPVIRWLVQIIIDFLGIKAGDFKIKWKPKMELDEKGQTEIKVAKVGALIQLLNAGFSLDSALKYLNMEGLELDMPVLDMMQQQQQMAQVQSQAILTV